VVHLNRPKIPGLKIFKKGKFLMRRTSLAGALVCAGIAWGQTQVDLGKQSKNIDFSAAAETRPMKTGSTLPAVCQTGDMYFKTDAPAGANIYSCVAVNTWAAPSSGTASGFQAAISDGQTTSTATVVTVAAGTFRSNNTVAKISSSATIQSNPGSLAAGSQIWIEFDPATKALFMVSNPNVVQNSLTLVNLNLGASNASGYSSGRIPVSTCTGGATADQWTTCTDARTPMSTVALNPGAGIQIAPAADGSLTISSTGDTSGSSSSSGGSTTVTVPSNPTAYYAAGPGTPACPSAITPIGSYQFPATANISPGDHINVVAWFKHTGSSTNPFINIRWAGTANSIDTGNLGYIAMAFNDTWAMEVDAVILSGTSLATYTRYMRYGSGGYYGGGTFVPNGLNIPSNLLIEFTAGGCSGGDTVQLIGSKITLTKAGSL
jgi:hypothetical protein